MNAIDHRERVSRKYERLQGLEALYATYEQMGWKPCDNPSMVALKKKILSVRNQMLAMGPGISPENAVSSRKKEDGRLKMGEA
jgi:hypothetical protein